MACSRRLPQRPTRVAGFVLAVTLWILAGIAIVVGLVTIWSVEAVRDAAGDRQRVDDQIAMLGTRDALLYLAATRDMTLAGLPTRPLGDAERATRLLEEFGAFRRDPIGGELRLDGQAYAGLDGTTFALQDEAGLFSLPWPQGAALDQFLAAQGIAREQIPNLRDPLLDYIDLDNLRQLHGAEAGEYKKRSLPPPPNRRLLLPLELGRIIGWRELPEAQREALAELSTTFYAGAFNLNTAPAALLPGWLSGCPQACEALVARREIRPFNTSTEIETLLGVRLSGDSMMEYRYAPSDTLRLTLWGRTGTAWRIHVRLTALADQSAPWSVLAAYPVPRPPLHAPPQPTGSALFADTPPDRP